MHVPLSKPRAGSSFTNILRLNPSMLLNRAAAGAWWLTVFCLPLNVGSIIQVPGSAMASLHLSLFELPMVITLALWALFLLMEPGSRLRLGPRLPIVALVGLSALALLGAPVAALHGVALMMGTRLWLLTLFYLFTVNNPPSTLRAGSALACSLAVQAAVAVAQVQRQSSIGLGVLGESQLNPHTHGVAVVLFHGQRWLRAYGLNGHPNPLGGLAACALLLAIVTLPRRLAIFTVACSGVLLLSTLSRGAWLAAGVGLILLLAARRRYRPPTRRQLARLIIALGLLVAAWPLVATRFDAHSPLEQQSVAARLIELGQVLRLIALHPLLGVGADCYRAALATVLPIANYAPYGPPVVHNAYLLSAAETGIAAPLLLALALLGPIITALRERRRGPNVLGPATALAACAALGLVDFYVWSSPSFRVFWVTLLGMWSAAALHAQTAGYAHNKLGRSRASCGG